MTLKEIIVHLNEFDENKVIFAQKPWSADSLAVVENLDEDLRIPAALKHNGYEYMLEIFIFMEVIGVLDDKKRTLQNLIELIIYYSSFDAYPEWVYHK